MAGVEVERPDPGAHAEFLSLNADRSRPILQDAAQRAFGLSGPVLHGRYHLRILRTPREVRRALAYVLLNARKHWYERHGASPPERLDAGRLPDNLLG